MSSSIDFAQPPVVKTDTSAPEKDSPTTDETRTPQGAGTPRVRVDFDFFDPNGEPLDIGTFVSYYSAVVWTKDAVILVLDPAAAGHSFYLPARKRCKIDITVKRDGQRARRATVVPLGINFSYDVETGDGDTRQTTFIYLQKIAEHDEDID